MTPERLVPTRELCQKLVDSGIVLDTYFVWVLIEGTWELRYREAVEHLEGTKFLISAPTAEELWGCADSDIKSAFTTGHEILEGMNLTSALAELAIKVKKS